MCDKCIHKPVCSIYRATGGVKKCEHHIADSKDLFDTVCNIDWKTNRDQIKNGYCPLCNKAFSLYTNRNMVSCPDCGHHVSLHIPYEHNEDLSDGGLE